MNVLKIDQTGLIEIGKWDAHRRRIPIFFSNIFFTRDILLTLKNTLVLWMLLDLFFLALLRRIICMI